MKPGDEAGGCVIQGLSSATLVEATTITMCGIFGKTVYWNFVIWHCGSFI
jgi:hypothetical protein